MIPGTREKSTPKTVCDPRHISRINRASLDFPGDPLAAPIGIQRSTSMRPTHNAQPAALTRVASAVALIAAARLLFSGIQPSAIGASPKVTMSSVLEPGLLDAAVKTWLKGKKVPVIVQ